MAWVVAISILAVAYLFLAGYRRAAAGLAVTVLVVAVALYLYYQRREDVVTSRISVSEIALENAALRPTFRSSYDLTGTLRNRSTQYRLDGIDVTVTLRDCTGKDQSTCTVIGQASASTAVTVPPEESRDFVASLYFGGDRPKTKGRLEWDYEITAVTARRQ